MSYDRYEDIDWVNLLKGAVKLELDDLITAIERLLITKSKELIQPNILVVQKFALSTARLNRLLNYCNQTMASHPDIIFKSNNLSSLPKETLITLLQNDDLNMKEGDIWMAVIEWAIGQVPGLTNDPNNWSPDEVNTIKGLVADCIPHVRFVDIAYEELFEKFVLYLELLPRKLRNDIFAHHLHKNKTTSRDHPLRGYMNKKDIRPVEPTIDWSYQVGNRKEENRPDDTAILVWGRQKGNRKEENRRDSSSGGRRQRYRQQDENEDNAGRGWNGSDWLS